MNNTCPQNINCNQNGPNQPGMELQGEVIVGNILFKYNLNEVNDCTYDLVCTPCNIPTSVYCIARITQRQNCCNNMSYYQSFINTDPVEIIQDCSLTQTICRSIETYFQNVPTINTYSSSNRNSFGLF